MTAFRRQGGSTSCSMETLGHAKRLAPSSCRRAHPFAAKDKPMYQRLTDPFLSFKKSTFSNWKRLLDKLF
jgi:hypothetical protein